MDKNIQRLVKKQSAAIKPTITADDLFTSIEYAEHIKSLVDTTTGRYFVPVKVTLLHGGPVSTAFTDGQSITQNTKSGLVYALDSLAGKYMANVGMVMHECSHILFCDFDAEKKCLDMVADGLFFGAEPEAKTQESISALADMQDAMSQKTSYKKSRGK